MDNDEVKSIALEDIFTASAHGVLRALSARDERFNKISTTDLIKSGFVVNINIWAGGPFNPELLKQLGLKDRLEERGG